MKRVLVTRPEGQNQSLLAALQKSGYTTDSLPVLKIAPYTPVAHAEQCQQIIKQVKNLASYQHIVFVSTNAVQCAFDWINQYHSELPASIRWYPIGDATARALEPFVARVEQAGKDMDSETLLLNPYLQNITGHRVLIFRGQGGRNFLRDNLQQRGAEVEFCELYQRQFVRYAAGTLTEKLHKKPDFVIITSTESIQSLVEQAIIEDAKSLLLQQTIIVPGKRVSQFAKEQGFQKVLTSPNAGLEATMETVQQQ